MVHGITQSETKNIIDKQIVWGENRWDPRNISYFNENPEYPVFFHQIKQNDIILFWHILIYSRYTLNISLECHV